MSNRSFMANSWLLSHSSPNSGSEGDPTLSAESYSVDRKPVNRASDAFLPPLPTESESFVPSRYFIPGWSGHSIFSKSANAVKKVQEQLWEDALRKFKKNEKLPRSLAQAIHNEFLGFLKTQKIKDSEYLQQPNSFWLEMAKENSPYKKVLNDFSELYSFRVATNYLLRLKFLVTFSRATGFDFQTAHILNPSSFSSQLFKRGSSSEINCEAFKINQYSWYRPSHDLVDRLEKLTRSFHEISITQLMKISSYRAFQSSRNSLKFDEKGYSHALSHRAFGQFINQLLIFFPIWQKQENFVYPRGTSIHKPEILNTKFLGERIESLGQSHWLAQEANMNLTWSEILCSEFASEYPGAETFVRLSQELQFLTFLVAYSRGKKLNAKELVSRITRERFQKSQTYRGNQFSLFSHRDLSYDRCVLNIGKLPKKNPHHYLINKILSQKDSLVCGAQMIVLSNQKLFVPSQSKKVADLLREFKVEGIFNLEKLKGKGEIASFIYIFSKRDPFAPAENLFAMAPDQLSREKGSKQESCYTFRWQGELKIFSQFEVLVKELKNFFLNRSSFSTSMYHRNLTHSLLFEFHQDAIIDGKLLSSLGNDRENITHPQFFKNLTKSCVPLDQFFSINEINENAQRSLTSDLLGISSFSQNSSYQVLIINLTEPLSPRIEIIPKTALKAKQEEYGVAFYHYYKITPKISHINFNLLREFFDSDLGTQIIQICLSGGAAKLKGKLRSLLVPRFFGEGFELHNSEFSNSPFLNMDENSILSLHPGELKRQYNIEIQRLRLLKEQSTWGYLSLLAHIKLLLKLSQEKASSDDNEKINFSNPLIKEELLKLPTFGVYPNEEVYTEILIESKSDLEKPATRLSINLGENSELEVFHGEQCLIKFHADFEILCFIEFIMENAKGHSLLTILQNLQVPRSLELREITGRYSEVKANLDTLFHEVGHQLKTEITKEIAQV